MKYISATIDNLDTIYNLVQNTIRTIYPKYYPTEVVDFFCEHHNPENIRKDIESGVVGILLVDGNIVGTGSYNDNHITRVYVNPDFQGKGYGSYIMQYLENIISHTYDSVSLDASLPASHLYERRGYKTIEHNKWNVANGRVLVYEVMEKELPSNTTNVSYNEKQFIPKMNTENGEVNSQTIFSYHQKGNILWADYSGGEITKGHLIGFVDANGELDFYYHHVNEQNQMRVGKCHSVPHILENGKLELHEQWQWLNGDCSEGSSILEEK